jgi:hypothetical protein
MYALAAVLERRHALGEVPVTNFRRVQVGSQTYIHRYMSFYGHGYETYGLASNASPGAPHRSTLLRRNMSKSIPSLTSKVTGKVRSTYHTHCTSLPAPKASIPTTPNHCTMPPPYRNTQVSYSCGTMPRSSNILIARFIQRQGLTCRIRTLGPITSMMQDCAKITASAQRDSTPTYSTRPQDPNP